MKFKSARSRRKAEILADETRCIYCEALPTSVEHMPPKTMFRPDTRPSGLEFASCRACNNGTSAADLVAGYVALFSPRHDQPEWKMVEARSREHMLNVKAPGFLEEFFDPARSQITEKHDAAGVLGSMVTMNASGPMMEAYLDVFAAKFGMAMYREHCGAPIPLEGGVFTAVYMNSGLLQETADFLISVLPLGASLRQGQNTGHDQFFYWFNGDGQGLVAAFAEFHDRLYICTIAFDDLMFAEKIVCPPAWRLVRPGELLGKMPVRSRTWAVRQPQPKVRAIYRLLAALTPQAASGDPKP